MPALTDDGVGRRIAYYRSVSRPKMTQQQLADAASVAIGTIRKIERGERGVTDATLAAIADALGVDPARLRSDRGPAQTRVHAALPALSAAIATYDLPDDGPVRPLRELRLAVAEAARWRVTAQYTRIVRALPDLLVELARALHEALAEDRAEVAGLLVRAYRSADAVAYKYGARDLSARLVDLMGWAAPEANDPMLTASVAYERTETFFAARAHAAGLRALEQALDVTPAPVSASAIAARGALHMRAAVIAGRAEDDAAATSHLDDARELADQVPEGVYCGTAFGPDY
ncbi:helix-turn-helix domain-containing protein [Streptomyces flaveolus]|uniref:helix-turn-helix domain-containing protein n=1 Tax=Streptomyces flaveolus TaxID=67297 RepID=UPI0033F1018C